MKFKQRELGAVKTLLSFVGEDPARQGLQETPQRFLKAMKEWSSGYETDIAGIFKTFEDGAEGVDGLVIVEGIDFFSHCEHHMAPFFGTVHIGYVPNGKVVGLSKLARVVDAFAHRFQVQERMTREIADAVEEHLQPLGVAVVVQARHMCMESRGIRKRGQSTLTSARRGQLRDESFYRHEFLPQVLR
ncbi:GTP cyclohydrolase I FolE [Burkholderia cenocepacia]|uniref:GTP cyclohydrolase I FolE n=1 Tax=Burkholderia cenocepacia TaxID=95486 RepID=UPI000760FA28|nr:GTP cyclohydrolase I FolE [Burkholderia cenocepacia]KWU19178.1 GTP cyclohydrolase [Burkholderia cenocepacia]